MASTSPDRLNAPGARPLPELIDLFDDYLRGQRKASQYTRRNYAHTLHRFDEFLRGHLGAVANERHLELLEMRDFRGFLASRASEGAKSPSLKLDLSALRSFFRYLRTNFALENDAILAMRGPRAKERLPRPVGETDAARLLEVVGESDRPDWVRARDLAVFILLYGAGLRISEALQLKWQDVPLKDDLRMLGKGNKMRIVPLIAPVIDAVNRYAELCPFQGEKEEALFRSTRGNPLGPRNVQRDMKIYGRLLGLPDSATPHALRHSFATHLLAHGGDLRSVQELLGHSSIVATQRYTKIDQTQMMEIYSKTHPRA